MRLRKLLSAYLVLSGVLVHLAALVLLILVLRAGPSEALRTLHYYFERGQARVVETAHGVEAYLAARSVRKLGLQAAADAYVFRDLGVALEGTQGSGRILQVGRGRLYPRPSAAAAVAGEGDIVEIDAGEYRGDTALWRTNNLVLRGVGGVAHMNGDAVKLVQDKAIWLIVGAHVRVENIEFSQARSGDLNGAGIRAEGDDLYVLSCFFHDNETGVLSNPIPGGKLRIEYSEFARNGQAGGQAHQVYANAMQELQVRFSYFHDTLAGSALKSRARINRIEFNRIVDGANGSSNYAIDLSEGGSAYVTGNLIEHGPHAGNGVLIAFAPEQAGRSEDQLLMVHNTLVNDRFRGSFVANYGSGSVTLYNNLFIGSGPVMRGQALAIGNVVANRGLFDADSASLGGIEGSHANRALGDAGIVSRGGLDYRLRSASGAIDAGQPFEADGQHSSQPAHEYRAPLAAAPRVLHGLPDAGALEFVE